MLLEDVFQVARYALKTVPEGTWVPFRSNIVFLVASIACLVSVGPSVYG